MRAVLVLLLVVLIASGCGKAAPKKVDTAPIPKGFELPAGLTLTKGGTALGLGRVAAVIYQVADKTRSAITISVDSVVKGNIAKDFRFFSLDDAAKASTPYYVTATVKNIGPAGLGGAPVPLYAHDSTNTVAPPNELVGDFQPCPNGRLPASFLPASIAKVCLVFLIPKGMTLRTIDLQTVDLTTPVTWNPAK